MKLSSFLNPKIILLNQVASDHQSALNILIEKITIEFYYEIDKNNLQNSVDEREKLGGTVFETGIAIPHSRLDNFNDLIIGVFVPKEPYDYQGKKVKMIVMIISSKSSSNNYLNILSSWIKISQNDSLFNRLIQSENSSRFIDIIESENIRIKKEITVSDIMTKDVITVTPETSIKVVADLFYKHNISFLPVVDDNENIEGELGMLDLIKYGIPNYAVLIGNLKFLKSFEPFEDLLKNEETITVSQVMKLPRKPLEPHASIIEAAFEMTQEKLRHLLVVENNKLIGVVSFTDILKKVLRG